MAAVGLAMCFFSILLISISNLASSQFLLKPFPVFGDIQKDVIIYCQIDDVNFTGDVYWGLPNDLGAIGPNKNSNLDHGRYTFTGESGQGYYNLKIESVSIADEGDYVCIYVGTRMDSGERFTAEIMTTLNVTTQDPEKQATISCDSLGGLAFDFNATDKLPPYICVAEEGVPLAGGYELSWYFQLKDNTLRKIPGIITVDKDVPSVTSQIDSENVILSGEEDDSFLLCTTGPLSSDPLPPTCLVPELTDQNNRIRVRYRPIVKFLPSEIEVGMFESFELQIKCLADGNPPLTGPPRLTLDGGINLQNDTLVEGDDDLVTNRQFVRVTLILTRADVGRSINCTASNDIDSTTISIEIKSLASFPVWLIFAIILIGGFLLFIALLFSILCCCKCDLEHERKRTERRRRTVRESKVNGVQSDDELNDVDVRIYDTPPVMMPAESPQDSGNDPDSDGGSAMVNDFKIEEPEEGHEITVATNNYGYDDEDDPPKQEYLKVAIADDTDGEELQLDELSRDDSPSLNEL